MYFASQSMLKKYMRYHRNHLPEQASPDQAIQRVRPLRIAAMKNRELMVVIASRENGTDVEWLDEEYVDVLKLDRRASFSDTSYYS